MGFAPSGRAIQNQSASRDIEVKQVNIKLDEWNMKIQDGTSIDASVVEKDKSANCVIGRQSKQDS